ncbi:MAG: DUF262 domain-containing protein [Terriglobia bacterium]
MYSWEAEQIEQLWDDLYQAFNDNDESYFLGPTIFVRKEEGHFDVVDGQQRLTTLTILFAVLRDYYLKGSATTRSNAVRNAIQSLIDNKYRLRLVTQMNYQNQFEQEILNGIDLNQLKSTKAMSSFQGAALIFNTKLEELRGAAGNERVEHFVDYLLNRVVMITITCFNQHSAIKLFQVLNTRGLELSPADLIKSYLYGECEGETKKKQLVATWNEIVTITDHMKPEESVSDLLTYYEYYLLVQNPKRTLYEELTDQFEKKDPNTVVYDFKSFVEAFNDVASAQSKAIYSFLYLPNQVFWKAILATAKKVSYPDFDGLCQEIRRVYYSYWVAGYTTSKIKQMSFNLIGWVKALSPLSEIRTQIEGRMKADSVMKYANDNLDGDVYGKPWLKPLLILIEYAQTDDSKTAFIQMDQRLHVDHILPQGWNAFEEWKAMWDEKAAAKWLNKIGNLTLLSGRKNQQASNLPFTDKKKIYAGKGLDGTVAFLMSQRIIEIPNWLEGAVAERQKEMLGDVSRILEIEVLEASAQSEHALPGSTTDFSIIPSPEPWNDLTDDEVGESSSLSREDWEKKAPLEIVDACLAILKGIDTALDLNYRKSHIGLKIHGRVNNFIVFYPKQHFTRVSGWVSNRDAWVESLRTAGLSDVAVGGHSGRKIILRLNRADIQLHSDLLKRFFKACYHEE